MKLVRNEKKIKQNKQIGNILTFTSLAVLGLGLYFAFQKNTTMIIYSYVCLIIGFILTQLGLGFVNRYGRSPRYDEIIGSSFAKLRHDYTYYVYTTELPMLLVSPCRIWMPIPITATGEISYANGKWVHKTKNKIQKLMGQDTVGKPEKEITFSLGVLKKYLMENGIPAEMQPEVKPIMVVYLKETILGDVSGAPCPVVELEDLKRYIRRVDREECADPIDADLLTKLKTALAHGLPETETAGAE